MPHNHMQCICVHACNHLEHVFISNLLISVHMCTGMCTYTCMYICWFEALFVDVYVSIKIVVYKWIHIIYVHVYTEPKAPKIAELCGILRGSIWKQIRGPMFPRIVSLTPDKL